MKRILFFLIFALAGFAVLMALGTWQAQRLVWKEALLSEIDRRIAADPVDLPEQVDRLRDLYLPVRAEGVIGPQELHVLVSQKQIGAGYRIISVFETGGRRILLDRGFVALDQKDAPRGAVQASVTGNLHWPNEVDGYTPVPDAKAQIWFARDVDAMAGEMGTEPVMIILRETSENPAAVAPLPLDRAGIPNDHLQYAITWFSLAAVWAAMTGFFLWRHRQSAKAE